MLRETSNCEGGPCGPSGLELGFAMNKDQDPPSIFSWGYIDFNSGYLGLRESGYGV